jgi:hypothetical protein
VFINGLFKTFAFAVEAFALMAAFRHDDGLAYRSGTHEKLPGEAGLVGSRKPIMLCSLYCFLYVGVESTVIVPPHFQVSG